MEHYRFPAATPTRDPTELHEDAQRRHAVPDRIQSATDSDSVSGCESGSGDQSPSPTPQERQRSCASTRSFSVLSFSADDSATGVPSLGEASRGKIERTQQQERQQPARTAASAATASRAAAKIAAGIACLAPRRLRSQVPPRVKWVSGKFIRQLGSDEHHTTQIPGCASFVYSACHVEGYDIRAVHQDALQKHVGCRLMNEEHSALMLEVDDSLQLADAKARSHEAFEAICGLHGAMTGCSQLEAADGVRSCASAVMAGNAGEESAWGWHSPPTTSPRTGAPSGSRVAHGDSSSEIDTAAAGGARSLRRGMRSLSSGMQRYGAANITMAFIFESGPVVLWIAASDARAKDSRGRRELLSSLLFFLSQFATRFVRADMMQEDVMRFAYIHQVRKMYPAYEVPKSRIFKDCIYLKTESITEKLAASFALSQSIRLSVYESLINFTIARVRAIPERMAQFGSADGGSIVSSGYSAWALLRRLVRWSSARAVPPIATMQPLAWSCLCGDLLGKIVDVNIVQDFRDVPEYFWNDDTWQHFWRRLYGHLEIQKRIDLLNSRYFCIHELLKVIREERRTRQEFRLTWIVVILLFSQVIALALRNFVIHPYEREQSHTV